MEKKTKKIGLLPKLLFAIVLGVVVGNIAQNTNLPTCFLADMNDFSAFNAVYGKYFTSKPARSCVAVKNIPKNLLCEIEITAVLKK